MSSIQEIAISHFGRKVVKALAKKQIELIDLTFLPGENGDFTTGQTGYVLNNNEQSQVRTYLEVLKMVA